MRELDYLNLPFLGRVRGGLWCQLLHRGPDKGELHLPDFLFLDLLGTVARMGAQVVWLLGMGGAGKRKFTGVSFLS